MIEVCFSTARKNSTCNIEDLKILFLLVFTFPFLENLLTARLIVSVRNNFASIIVLLGENTTGGLLKTLA